jgi:hypothetical protein
MAESLWLLYSINRITPLPPPSLRFLPDRVLSPSLLKKSSSSPRSAPYSPSSSSIKSPATWTQSIIELTQIMCSKTAGGLLCWLLCWCTQAVCAKPCGADTGSNGVADGADAQTVGNKQTSGFSNLLLVSSLPILIGFHRVGKTSCC